MHESQEMLQYDYFFFKDLVTDSTRISNVTDGCNKEIFFQITLSCNAIIVAIYTYSLSRVLCKTNICQKIDSLLTFRHKLLIMIKFSRGYELPFSNFINVCEYRSHV